MFNKYAEDNEDVEAIEYTLTDLRNIFNQPYYPTKKYYTIALNPPILRSLFLEHSFPKNDLFELAFLDTYKLSTMSDTEIPVEKYTLNLFLSDIRDNSKNHLLNFIKFSKHGTKGSWRVILSKSPATFFR